MNKILGVFLGLFFTAVLHGQQLNCTVVVNAEQTGRANMSIFKTLENSLTEFVNETAWTDERGENHEMINCSMVINIQNFEGNSFSGTIQVQSSRPVFNSTYTTPVFNFNDEQLNFTYTEHQPFNYDRNSYSNNLVSVVAFYVYTILGLDADTFELEGGSDFFKEASQIVGTAQQGRESGWRPSDGNQTRYRLNTDLLSNVFVAYRESMYNYHRHGLDKMATNQEEAKSTMLSALQNLQNLTSRSGNPLLLRIFFDAKAGEVEKVFSGGPEVPLTELLSTLNNIAPSYSKNWRNIKN